MHATTNGSKMCKKIVTGLAVIDILPHSRFRLLERASGVNVN